MVKDDIDRTWQFDKNGILHSGSSLTKCSANKLKLYWAQIRQVKTHKYQNDGPGILVMQGKIGHGILDAEKELL